MKPLYLDWNLGLGDAIICNGLVRWLARENPGKDILLPVYDRNRESVTQLFRDVPNVLIDISNAMELDAEQTRNFALGWGCDEVLHIGLNNPRWGQVQPFDRAFYEFAGVPFEAKWDLFHIPDSKCELCPHPLERPFVLIHEDKKRGFEIDAEKIPGMTKIPGMNWIRRERMPIFVGPYHDTPRISDWRYMIRDAAEIHCIDSSVMHLAELLPTTGKLFYHRYARPSKERQYVDAVFRKPWEVLD